jgi:hypothetical protein
MRLPRITTIFGIFKVREKGNLEYWVSQFVVLTSTVLGVFLAAQAGYSTAIQFEVTRGERDGYYLRRALVSEIKNNLNAVDEWSREFENELRAKIDPTYFEPTDNWLHFFWRKEGWKHLGELSDPMLRRKIRRASWEKRPEIRTENKLLPGDLKMKTFVWDTMKEQFTTFQLSPEVLMIVQNYYNNMDNNVKDARSNTELAGPAAAKILSDTQKMRETVVAYIEEDMAALRTKLEAKNIDIR